MEIIAWIIFGSLAGWIASFIVGTNREQGPLMDIAVGIVGALVGGTAYTLLTGQSFTAGFDLPSFAIAVLGAVVLLSLIKYFRRRQAGQ